MRQLAQLRWRRPRSQRPDPKAAPRARASPCPDCKTGSGARPASCDALRLPFSPWPGPPRVEWPSSWLCCTEAPRLLVAWSAAWTLTWAARSMAAPSAAWARRAYCVEPPSAAWARPAHCVRSPFSFGPGPAYFEQPAVAKPRCLRKPFYSLRAESGSRSLQIKSGVRYPSAWDARRVRSLEKQLSVRSAPS